MPIQNTWKYTQTTFDAEEFKKATNNEFQLVSQRPYQSKKNAEDIGTSITLLILKDTSDYGIDKKTGLKRDNNVLNTFDVTILNGKTSLPIQKGAKVSLGKLIPEKSFVIGFDLILRFDDLKKVGG